MSELNVVDISKLKTCKDRFDDEKSNFKSSTYQTFKSSYLNNCSDYYVRQMTSNLESLYSKIDIGYINIDKWWESYNENIECLERCLSTNKGGYGALESSVRNYVLNQIPKLNDYKKTNDINFNLSNTFISNTSFAVNGVTSLKNRFSSIFSDYDIEQDNNIKKEFNKVSGKIKESSNSTTENITEWFESVKESVSSKLDDVKATITSGFKSAWNSLSDFKDKAENVFESVSGNVSNAKSMIYENITNWYTDVSKSISNKLNDVKATISKTSNNIWSGINNFSNDAVNWWNTKASPWLNNTASSVANTLNKTAATIANVVLSLTEGIANVGEAVVDLIAIAGAVVATVPTTFVDLIKYINGNITGENWESETKKVWDETMAFVSKEYVKTAFDSFYKGAGSWVKENSFYFDNIRNITSGVGYVAGIVVLTVLTFGVGGSVIGASSSAVSTISATQMGFLAGSLGIANGAETAWKDGANAVEGLVAGGVTGLWEGFQYYFGGKLAATSFVKGANSFSKVINSSIRVSADGATGAFEGGIQPLIKTIYKDSYIDENGNEIKFSNEDDFLEKYGKIFNENGGWNFVLTNATIGAISSSLGEGIDFGKYIKNSKKVIDSKTPKMEINDVDIDIKLKRYNELLKIVNTKDYQEYVDNINKAYAQPINMEFENVYDEFRKLSKELYNNQKVNSQKISINELSYKEYNKFNYVLEYLKSNFRKFVYENTSNYDGLNDEILKNGLYHFTDKTNLILNSNYIKTSGYSASYGLKKTFFFNGVPEVGAFIHNIDKFPLKTKAIKIIPTKEALNNNLFQVRSIDDGAITHTGEFHFNENNVQSVSEELFCLRKDGDKLVYQKVDKEFYDSYEFTDEGKTLSQFIMNKQNAHIIEGDFLANIEANSTKANYGKSTSILNAKDISNSNEKAMVPISAINEQLELNNSGKLGLLYVDSLDQIPSEFWDTKVKNPSLFYIATSTKNFTFDEAKKIMKPNVDSSNLIEQLISKINYDSKKGHFCKINFNSYDEIPSDFWNKIDDPDNLTIYVNNNPMDFDTAKFNYDYLKSNKVNTEIKFKNREEAAIYFEDPKMFLVSKIDYYLDKYQSNNEAFENLNKIKNSITGKKSSTIDLKELYKNMYQYLDKDDKEILDTMLKDVNNVHNKLSNEEKLVIENFTGYGGPAVSSYLRKLSYVFNGKQSNFVNKNDANKYLHKVFNHFGRLNEVPSTLFDVDNFIYTLDNIIKKANPLKKDIIVYRGVQDLFLDDVNLTNVDLQNKKINILNIGQKFNDKAYTSFSVLPPEKLRNDFKIYMKVKVPKGTKAQFIESYSGVKNYGQNELLAGRNQMFEVTKPPVFDEKLNVFVMEAELVLKNSE